jgi:glycosyltransferase involved in cell wall biosynthesis
VDIKAIYSLRRYIRENAIDIIHSHKYKTNLYSLLAGIGTDCKLISTCHNWLGNSFNMRFYAWLDKKILRKFDAVIGVSNEVVHELEKNIKDGKIKKIENGIDTKKYYRIKNRDEAKESLGLKDKKLIGFIGRLSQEKGVSYLLQAVKTLVNNGNDVYALIVGDGEFKENLKKEASSLGLADRVIFTGNRQDTPLIYSALDVFVLPSLKEAFPMVILEAMACGTPVVATKVGDIPCIIEDNVSGLIVEPRDVEGLCRAINELLFSNGKTERFIEFAANKVQKNYSSSIMAEKYQEIYEKVLCQ